MIEKKIDRLAYMLKQNKDKNRPGAIVFIGAGCSVSAGIPSADAIVNFVLENFKDNPDIKCLAPKPSYSELMECLGPLERNRVFKHYVDAAKINVSHIYLAHLMANNYVDYIVTVNFDNLTQRALALYNIFPPTYDISILKDLTTTTLDTKSITYLHGQYNGLWQLNTKEEMRKVIESNVAHIIFNKITNDRPWIVVGYSGDDPIFDQLAKLGRFDNGLYWIGYKDNEPSSKVKVNLLDKPNTESFWVKGYDADSFFLKLNAELKNDNPKIFDTPFSYLKEIQEGIIDIEDSEEYKLVKERFIESNKMVQDAINKYEKVQSEEPPMTKHEIEENQIRKTLIDCLINEKYDNIVDLENQVQKNGYKNLRPIISGLYNNWGIFLKIQAKTKSGKEAEDIIRKSIEKFEKAIQIQPDSYITYNNWGDLLVELTTVKTGNESDELFKSAFNKYSQSAKIKPNCAETFFNWGSSVGIFSELKSGEEKETLLQIAIDKFIKAIEIKPDLDEAYNRCGIYLGKLADSQNKDEATKSLIQANKRFAQAIELKPDKYEAYNNWGLSLRNLGKLKSGEESCNLFNQAIEKFTRAIEINSNSYEGYFNCGITLINLASLKLQKKVDMFFLKAFEMFSNAIKIKPDYDTAYFNWANGLLELAKTKSDKEASKLLEEAFKKYSQILKINPNDYEALNNWGVSLGNLAEIKSGEEAEEIYKQAFEKYYLAVKIKPDTHEIYSNWGDSLMNLAKTKSGEEADQLYQQAIEKLNDAINYGGSTYNLACLYALRNLPNNAFPLLEKCLIDRNTLFEFVEKDSDWDNLRTDIRYEVLKNRFGK
jgi:tetratricopeptide (TPR) repeat protein